MSYQRFTGSPLRMVVAGLLMTLTLLMIDYVLTSYLSQNLLSFPNTFQLKARLYVEDGFFFRHIRECLMLSTTYLFWQTMRSIVASILFDDVRKGQ